MQGEQSKLSFTDFKFAMNFVSGLALTLAQPINAILHEGWGERAAGIPGAIAVPLLVVYGALLVGHGSWTIALVVFLYLVMCVVWRIYAIYRRRRLKIAVHSRYVGRPWLYQGLWHQGSFEPLVDRRRCVTSSAPTSRFIATPS